MMAAIAPTEYGGITILERCLVSPPLNTAAEQSLTLPLTHFDIAWLPSCIAQCIFFYNFPCSKSHFLDIIVPNLKNSLSATLRHFLPLVGNIVFPLNDRPICRYEVGDSILLTIAESTDEDFADLTGNHAREAHRFHAFVPELPLATTNIKLFSVQISFFPNQGFCIGFSCEHAIADGITFFNFVSAWATVSKLKGDDSHLLRKRHDHLPFYDRSNVEDPDGLDSIYWNQVMKNLIPLQMNESSSVPALKDKFRATFVMTESDIQELRKYVLDHNPGLEYVSSFIVTCAHVWVCLIKSAAEEDVNYSDDDELINYFTFHVDCRARLTPPLPATYFGNCIAPAKVELPHGKLKGDDGFLTAVEAIRITIHKIVYNEKGILNGAEKWLEEYFTNCTGKRVFGVAGSPRFDFYNADFGWGDPKKYECVHIDRDESISICKSKEFHGGLEIGLSRPKIQMDAFQSIFNKSLRSYIYIYDDDETS